MKSRGLGGDAVFPGPRAVPPACPGGGQTCSARRARGLGHVRDGDWASPARGHRAPTPCVQVEPAHPAGTWQAERHGPPAPPPQNGPQEKCRNSRQQKARPLSAPHAIYPPNHSVAGALLVMGVCTPGPTLTSPSNPPCHSDYPTQPPGE